MDKQLQDKLTETIEQLKLLSLKDIDLNHMDPVVKMMLVALIHETQKINDHIDSLRDRIEERYCADFIPRQEVEAMPAIALIHPRIKPNKGNGFIPIGSGHTFSYKALERKQALSYIPLFSTMTLPYSDTILMRQNNEYCKSVNMYKPNRLWLGIKTDVEIESVRGITLMVKGNQGINPEHIYINDTSHEIDFVTAKDMEQVEMAEPFDAQQASGQFFSFLDTWKECLLNMKDASLLFLTDKTQNRDLFKPRPFPETFKKWLEDSTLDGFMGAPSVWLCLDFPEGYVVPDKCEVLLNVIPVVNVEVCSLMLTQASPIAKLQKQDDSFFLRILETSTANHKLGFDMMNDEILVRDFDASCYHDGDLYRDLRNLYNHFTDDYYAFIEYNDIKDGEALKQLRETINKIANNSSVREPNKKYKFDSGTYVMKNMKLKNPSLATKVSYLTTQGKIGNAPKEGDIMENKKLPTIEQKVSVVAAAAGGADKASADERYELLRYYSLTNDRLYTKMDIDAFLRKEIMTEFGKDEFYRIFTKISIEGAGGNTKLQRGLYIDISFKDRKNYEKAIRLSFDKLMQQRITDKSCIAMPIIVKLSNLEG